MKKLLKINHDSKCQQNTLNFLKKMGKKSLAPKNTQIFLT